LTFLISFRSGWIKIKPEYCANLTDTCDLIVIGGYYSSALRMKAGTISHFLCAVRDGSTYRSLCRVRNGLNDKEIEKLSQKLLPHFTKKTNVFKNVQYGKDKPDLKIDPANSVVLEVKAAEFVKSSSYHAGCTLR